MTKSVWLLASGVLILLGIALFALQPGPPEPECATDPNATSGFTDPEQDCPISIESMNEIRDHQTSPKWFRIAGVGVGVVGIALVAMVSVARIRSPRRE